MLTHNCLNLNSFKDFQFNKIMLCIKLEFRKRFGNTNMFGDIFTQIFENHISDYFDIIGTQDVYETIVTILCCYLYSPAIQS